MRSRASAIVWAFVLAVGLGSVSTLADEKSQTSIKAVAGETSRSSGTFAVLSGVKAVRMAPRELGEVKGLHIHFTTPSQNAGHPNASGPFGQATGWHFVNLQENNLGNGQADAGSGPGYSGLCGAALNSPALTIPGQNTTTGVGAGC